MVTRSAWVSLLVFGTALAAWGQDRANLPMVSSGAMPQLGGYMPQRIELSPTKPASIKKLPADLHSPMFGTMKFRLASGTGDIVVMVNAPDSASPKLYVDANGNGDLTDDPIPELKAPAATVSEGNAMLAIGSADHPTDARVVFYWFHNDPNRTQFKNTLFYYRDYARIGTITLAGKQYKTALDDAQCTGDFGGAGAGSRVALLIDTNNSGALEMQPGKFFDASKPFNIGGVTYELSGMTPDGLFNIKHSAQSVPEVAPPPNLSTGQPVLSFVAQTMDGKTVHFPADYKGKIVLLDFWATWCGPCMGEVPGLAATYAKFHSRGFDVLGISLDNANDTAGVEKVLADNKMVWPQIYEGKGWQTSLAQTYGIQSIPHPILVDGDTGKIIAGDEGELRGDALPKTIDKQLTAKFGAAK